MSNLISYLWYEAAYCFSFAVMTLGFSLRIEGRRNIPRQGPVLLIANHQSFLDPILIGLASPRQLVFLARKTLFKHPLAARFISSLNAVPVDQEGIAKEGLKTVLAQLQAGNAVVVYPEGERTMDGAIHPLKPGIQLLIKKAKPLIVPIGIAGAFEAMPRWRLYPTLSPLFLPPGNSTIAVSVGKPIRAERYDDMPREQVLTDLFEVLQQLYRRAENLRRKDR